MPRHGSRGAKMLAALVVFLLSVFTPLTLAAPAAFAAGSAVFQIADNRSPWLIQRDQFGIQESDIVVSAVRNPSGWSWPVPWAIKIDDRQWNSRMEFWNDPPASGNDPTDGCHPVQESEFHRVAICPLGPVHQPFFVLGPGNDRLWIESLPPGNRSVYVFGNGGNDLMVDARAGNGQDHARMVFRGGPGNDWLVGGPDPDFLSGESGADLLVGGGGIDTANYGPDIFNLPDRFDTDGNINGGHWPQSADAYLWGPDQSEVYHHQPSVIADIGGASGNDGNAEDEAAPGSPIRDTIAVDVENIKGTTGDDVLVGDSAANQFDGDEGNDWLFGNGGNDVLQGGQDSDQEFGGAGDDTLGADGQNTSLSAVADRGNDTFYGGDGEDTMTYQSRNAGVTASIDNTANDGEPGEGDNVKTDVENLTGGRGADIFTGSNVPNTLRGGAGDDTLIGAGGNDKLYGEADKDRLLDDLFGCGSGNDTLDGGPDIDRLYGQCGQDTIYARDPIPGQFAFWIDTIDCGNDVPGKADPLPDKAQLNGSPWYPEQSPGCEQILP